MIDAGRDGYYHPANEDQVIALVKKAAREGSVLRVRGAGHSEPGAIYASGRAPVRPPGSGVNLLLDRMARVDFDEARMQVTVQAGCHLGYDPEDPSGTSSWENSLFQQLDRRGWALPDMGGITRQSVGGFLSTGSAGGSVEHSPGDLIVKLRLVDGEGNVHELERSDDPDNPFFAAGVSLGLLGIITSATLQCVPRYDVVGRERTSGYDDCEIDFFSAGSARPDLETFLKTTEHSRILWWPQKGAHKVTVWQASKAPAQAGLVPKPYVQVKKFFGSSVPSYAGIGLAFKLLDGLNPPAPRGILARHFEGALGFIYKAVAGQFLRPESQEFHDYWWRTLPMDDQTNYRLIPTEFTEIWLPIEKTAEVMSKLKRHFETGGYPATGVYACELYATSPSKFWMSPSYGRAMFRVDPFWPKNSQIDPHVHFYPQFWELLKDTGYTLHWAKALVDDPDYLRSQYPRWDDFMKLRAQMDPGQVFVNEYWRRHLAIPAA